MEFEKLTTKELEKKIQALRLEELTYGFNSDESNSDEINQLKTTLKALLNELQKRKGMEL